MNNEVTFDERSKINDNTSITDSTQVDQKSVPIVSGRLFNIISTLIVACIGLIAFKALGLYDAMDSTLGQVAVGGGIAWYFVACFRHALYR